MGAILLPILQHFFFFSFVVIFSSMYGYTYSVNELNKVSSFITNSSLFVLFLSALNSKFLHITFVAKSRNVCCSREQEKIENNTKKNKTCVAVRFLKLLLKVFFENGIFLENVVILFHN